MAAFIDEMQKQDGGYNLPEPDEKPKASVKKDVPSGAVVFDKQSTQK